MERAELNSGIYEFITPKEYILKPIGHYYISFVLELTERSV